MSLTMLLTLITISTLVVGFILGDEYDRYY